MSATGCPFWCVTHRVERREAFRGRCESAPVRLEHGAELLTLRLVRPAGRSRAVVEVAVGAQVALVPVQDVQTLMTSLRMLVGDAQRSGCAS